MKSFLHGIRVSHGVSLAIVALALSAGTVHAGRTQVSSIGHNQKQRSGSFTENRPVVITPRMDLIRDKGQPGTTPDLPKDARNGAPVAPASNFTQWAGNEQLAGFGKLSFQLYTDARAVMIDAQGATEGTWQRTVDRITLQFGGVVYAGILNGSSFSGASSDGAISWTWSVQFHAAGSVTNTKNQDADRDNAATITFVGTENLGGFGRLEFRFVPRTGQVTMVDSDGETVGAFTVQGDTVRLSFHEDTVVYTGTMSSESISGTATNGDVTWAFSVR